MPVSKIDPKVIFASEAPAQDAPAVFTNKTVGWGESRKNGGRPTIKQSNALQQETDLKILWLNENSVTPYDASIDYPVNAVTIKDGAFKIFNGSVWNLFLNKNSVGLNNVDNTSDLNKPVSTATQDSFDEIYENGACLPYDSTITYVLGSLVLRDGIIQKVVTGGTEPLIGNTDAVKVIDGNQTQKEINLYGGKKYDMPAGGYPVGGLVRLDNGDIVKSTVANNIINPNVDMTGWVYVSKSANSVSELLLLKGSNGNTIKLSSYYAGENKGGGSFYYDSTKLSINNGVTVFNGWVRDLSDKVLTAYDAGLKNDGTDATAKLRVIAKSIGANFTVKIYGKHCVTSNIMFDRVPGLKLLACNEGTQQGEINAWDLRDQWVFDRDTLTEAEIAVVRISDSPYSFTNLKVRGARKTLINFSENYEAGDCGIEFKRSPHSLVDGAELSDFITWGVCSDNSDYTIVQNSKISNCIRQSGLNIFNGQKHCQAINNHIYDCGLYGIELECNTSKPIGSGHKVTDNTVSGCKWGISIVDNILDAVIRGNKISDCYIGLAPWRLQYADSIEVTENIVKNCMRAAHYFNSINIDISKNIFRKGTPAQAYIVDQYSVYLEADTARTFWTFAWAEIGFDATYIGKTIYINGLSYVITAQQNFPDRGIYGTHYGYSGQTKITVDRDLAVGIIDNTLIKVVPPNANQYGIYSGALVGTGDADSLNNGVTITQNTLIGFGEGIRLNSVHAVGSAIKESIFDNTFIGCTTWVRTGYHNSGYNIGINSHSDSAAVFIQNESATNIQSKEKLGFTVTVAKPTNTDPIYINRFNLNESKTLIGLTLDFRNATTASDIVIRVDGGVRHTITLADFNANSVKFFVFDKVIANGLAKGVHTFDIRNANGDNTLTYTSYKADLLLV